MQNKCNFEAKISKILYENKETNSRICQVHTRSSIPYIEPKYGTYHTTIVGNFIPVEPGDVVQVVGEVVKHSKYGYQVKVEDVHFNKPLTKKEILAFLQAILTEKQANTLYDSYPNIIDNIITDENFVPDFNKLKGIQKKTWDKIQTKILNNFACSDIIALLNPLGCSLTMINHILKQYKNKTLLISEIKENPYFLCQFKGLGFKKVDTYALNLHPELRDSVERIEACLKYLFNELGDDEGHCWLSYETVLKKVKNLIGTVSHLQECINKQQLFSEQYIVNSISDIKKASFDFWLYVNEDKTKIGLLNVYNVEKYIYFKLKEISESSNDWELEEKYFNHTVIEVNKKQGFNLSKEQIEAVYSIAKNNITLISGKAGCGKTSIIKAVLEVYKDHNIAMGALSAKAAQRMKESSGFLMAKTIHRLLGFNRMGFMYNEDNYLPYDLVIIDECSMNNIYIFQSLLKAISPQTKIIFVGDIKQLPSIGTGAVFTDLINSNLFNKHYLTGIYRQSDDSYIVLHANDIREGKVPMKVIQPNMKYGEDTFYFFRNNSSDICDISVNLFLQFLQQGVPLEDLIIITPIKMNGDVCCNNLNNIIQDRLLGDIQESITIQNKVFKLGARIINRKNDYDKNILNGEMGTIIEIIDNKCVAKMDNGNIITFSSLDLENVDLGYAISCHSSQGSQYHTCIFALDSNSYKLLSANLVYTAMTRAKERIVVVANPRVFMRAVSNVSEINRNTFLSNFLHDYKEIS